MAAQLVGECGFDLFFQQLLFELEQEFVHHAADNGGGERGEGNHGVQAVAELGGEGFFDGGHFVAGFAFGGEAETVAAERFGAGIGGHNQDDVAKIGAFAGVVGEPAGVHHLQQNVVDVAVGFFDFVEQEHAVRVFADGFGQQSALVEADVARRRADQAGDGVRLHVFGHIEALQRHAQREGELFGDFGFAHAGGAGKQEAADGFVGQAETGARHFDGGGQRIDGGILAEDHVFQVAGEMAQDLFVVMGHGFFGNAGDFGDGLLDFAATDFAAAAFRLHDALGSAGFVDNIDGFVGQKAVGNVAGGKLSGSLKGVFAVAHAVVVLEGGLQAAQNIDGFGNAGLADVDFLKTAA